MNLVTIQPVRILITDEAQSFYSVYEALQTALDSEKTMIVKAGKFIEAVVINGVLYVPTQETL